MDAEHRVEGFKSEQAPMDGQRPAPSFQVACVLTGRCPQNGLHMDLRMPYPGGGWMWCEAGIAVASLYVKAAKSCFCARFLQIVQILESITYAESEAYGRTNPSSSAIDSRIGRPGGVRVI